MKEPWILKNAFWIIATFCLVTCLGAIGNDKDMYAVVFGIVGMFCIVAGIYYGNIDGFNQRQVRDQYDQAHYHQARQKTLKIITGGKSESLRTRTTGTRNGETPNGRK